MKIAVTGGYGSGKSSVTRLLSGYLGCTPVDTDQICRDLLQPGEKGTIGLEKEFGNRFLTGAGTVDRKLLREATFAEKEVKEKLEAILHPLVRESVAGLDKNRKNTSIFSVVEVPLLYEVGWHEDFDVAVLVRVGEETSIERTMERDSIHREEAVRIIALQLPMTCKEGLADYIIDNGSTFVSTAQQVGWLTNLLKKKYCIQ